MDTLTQAFEERLQEINAYLDLLDSFEREVREGPPKIGGTSITGQQQKILYSSAYLQLYNLVEATVTWCVKAVCTAVTNNGSWLPTDLSEQLRKEWIRVQARTHVPLNPDKRLVSAIAFFDCIAAVLPVAAWSVEIGGGGNWDEIEIEDISRRLGCSLEVSQSVLTGIKRKIRDDKNALGLIKHLRNRLAHGELSFAECGDGVTVGDLRDIKDCTEAYLREVVAAFRSFIDRHEYLAPMRRPIAGAL